MNWFKSASGVIAAAAFMVLSGAPDLPAQVEPRLSLQGDPHFQGDMTLTLEEPQSAGEFAWVALGANPAPILALQPTAIGPWAIGNLLQVLPAGPLPPDGRLDVSFNVGPVNPAALGLQLIAHGYVSDRLSNPATVPLVEAYFAFDDALTLLSPDPQQASLFADRVAVSDLDGDGHADIIAGSWFENVGGVPDAGRVYMFQGPDFTSAVPISTPLPVESGLFGQAFGIADVTGDGRDDLVLAQGPGPFPVPAGSFAHVFVFAGGTAGFVATPAVVVQSAGSGPEYEGFGRFMTAGDFDDDGFADVAVSVVLAATGGLPASGRIDVHWGPDLGTVTTLTAPTPDASAYFATCLLAEDVTGDGVEDLVLGVPHETVGGTYGIGRVYVFPGPGLDSPQILESPLPDGTNSRFGNALAAADLDGDGGVDLVATDMRDHTFIFWSPGFGQSTAIHRPPSVLAEGEDSVSYGYSVDVGDVNGDGWVDIAVGDPFSGPTGSACTGTSGGAVFVAMGPYFATHHVLFELTPNCMDEFGWDVAVADLDGDGIAELVVGDDTSDAGGVPNSGEITVFSRP